MAKRNPPTATSRSRWRGVGMGATAVQAPVLGLKAITEAVISSSVGLMGIAPPATYRRPPNAAAAAAPRGAGSLVANDHESVSGSYLSTTSTVASFVNP